MGTDGAGFDAWLALGALGFKTKFTQADEWDECSQTLTGQPGSALSNPAASAWLTSDHLALSRTPPWLSAGWGQRLAGLRGLRDLRDLREAGRGQAEPSSRMGAKRTDGAGFEAWLALGVLGFKTKFTRMQQ